LAAVLGLEISMVIFLSMLVFQDSLDRVGESKNSLTIDVLFAFLGAAGMINGLTDFADYPLIANGRSRLPSFRSSADVYGFTSP